MAARRAGARAAVRSFASAARTASRQPQSAAAAGEKTGVKMVKAAATAIRPADAGKRYLKTLSFVSKACRGASDARVPIRDVLIWDRSERQHHLREWLILAVRPLNARESAENRVDGRAPTL